MNLAAAQDVIMQHVAETGSITKRQAMALCGTTKGTALADLQRLTSGRRLERFWDDESSRSVWTLPSRKETT